MTIESVGDYEMNPDDIPNRAIGKGAFGYVYKGWRKGNVNMKVAIKVMRIHGNDKDNEINKKKKEIELMRKCCHENVLTAFADAWITQGVLRNCYVIITELCVRGCLYELVDKHCVNGLADGDCKQFLHAMYEGHLCLKRHGVLHRDYKPQNVLLYELAGRFIYKLADFGCACETAVDCSWNMNEYFLGTENYQTPRVHAFRKDNNLFTQTLSNKSYIDKWSLGVMTYFVLTGQRPFPVKPNSQLSLALEQWKPGMISVKWENQEWVPYKKLPKNILLSRDLADRVAELIADLMRSGSFQSRDFQMDFPSHMNRIDKVAVDPGNYFYNFPTPDAYNSPRVNLNSLNICDLYLCEPAFAEIDRFCYQLIAKNPEKPQFLVVVYFEMINHQAFVTAKFELQCAPFDDDAFWGNYLPDKYNRMPQHRIPYVCFTPKVPLRMMLDPVKLNKTISVFAFDEVQRKIKVIRLNEMEDLECDELPIHAWKEGRTKWFYLSPPYFLRVSQQHDGSTHVIDLHAIEWCPETTKWTMSITYSHSETFRVFQCKICQCGNVFAYSCNDENGSVQLKTVALPNGHVQSLGGFFSEKMDFRFRKYPRAHCACLLLLTDRGSHRLMSVTKNGSIDVVSPINAPNIPSVNENVRLLLRTAFSFCGEYLLTWNGSTASSAALYRVRSDSPNQEQYSLHYVDGNFPSPSPLHFQQDFQAVFDQCSFWRM